MPREHSTLPIAHVRVDGGTQPRAQMDWAMVAEYRVALDGGATFPPVVVFYDGESHWLADGFHRLSAANERGAEDISADVRQGTRRDAILYSVGANASHGLRRTNADKRRAVLRLLGDEEWGGWSDREIARRCEVSAPLVARVRESATVNSYSETPRTYTTKHGTTATMSTAAIGATPRPQVLPLTSEGIEQLREKEENKRVRARKLERSQSAKAERRASLPPPPEAPPGVDLRCCSVLDLMGQTAEESVDLVHADPPWVYDNQRLHGTAEGHYDLQGIEAIARDVDAAYSLAKQDSYLLLWCTWPMLADWLKATQDGYRWRYLSGGAWLKTGGRPGIGFHWRGRTEPLLLYAKGRPKPWRDTTPNGHSSEVGEHSEKPMTWLPELLETFCPPGGSVLDLYAGRAPMARAAVDTRRGYSGAEMDPHRHALALHALGVGDDPV